MTIEVEDLDKAEAWTGSAGLPIPVGEHVTEIAEVEEKPASTGTPQLIITWRVVDGPHRDAESREWLAVLPQTRGKVRAFLEAVDWPIPVGRAVLPTKELVNRRAQTVWREDTYNGKTQIKCMAHNRVPAVVGGDLPIVTEGLPPTAAAEDNEPLPF